MPIGENALKRVENNGYSKVSTACPDMENSTVETAMPAPAPKPVKKSEGSPKKAAPATHGKEGFERFSFGQELPYWLL